MTLHVTNKARIYHIEDLENHFVPQVYIAIFFMVKTLVSDYFCTQAGHTFVERVLGRH